MHMVLPKGRQTDDLPSVPSNKHLNCVRYVTTKIKLTKKRTQDNNDIKQKSIRFSVLGITYTHLTVPMAGYGAMRTF